jgi:ketosteroid isomerase-like protein
MRASADVLTDLFAALDRHDHRAMGACYDENVTFRAVSTRHRVV